MGTNLAENKRLELTRGEALGDEIAELCGYISAAMAHFLELLREFDEQRYWAELGFPSCVAWLNFKCGIGSGAARERLRIAHALENLPGIREKFGDGELSYSKVRAMTRVATPENENFLLMVAKHGSTNHIERLVSQYRRVEEQRRPDAAQEQFMSREVKYYYDDRGNVVIKGTIPADRGELVVKALEMSMDLAYDPEDETPVAARRADALCEIAETYMNNPEYSGSTADRYQVVVHVHGENTHLENGPCVSAETSKRIGCDCSKTVIEEDEFGEPLNIGRRTRTIPPSIRRALKSRDGGCRFPGCTNHKFVVGHHIQHWSNGGETSLDNLVLLCDFHHHLVHEGGYDCRRGEGGEIFFVDRRDERLAEFQTSPAKPIEESIAWMYRKFADLGVSAETSAAKWYAGEKMDHDIAVSTLCQIEDLARPPDI